jgi:hypothetical protein
VDAQADDRAYAGGVALVVFVFATVLMLGRAEKHWSRPAPRQRRRDPSLVADQ